MSSQDLIKPVLDGLLKLKPLAAAAFQTADQAWMQEAQSISGQPQWGSGEVMTKLIPLRAADQTASALVDHLSAYYALLVPWAINDDTYISLGLPRVPFPAPTPDVKALADQNGVSLALGSPAPPPPQSILYAFMVPGGYLALIGPSEGSSGGFPEVFKALPGDTVPPEMTVTAPDGRKFLRKRAPMPFPGVFEDWYFAAA